MEEKVDRLFKDYSGTQTPGAAVMIIKEGRLILKKGYGMANIEAQTAVTDSANFRLASLTKQFTAMSIMMLVEAGKLNYEDRLTAWFEDFPEYGRNISVRHLLQHTSGLIDYESLIPDTATRQVLDEDVLQMMIKQDSTYFEPGSDYRYSNSAYALLARLVEVVSGLRFAEFLQEYIFNPMDMNNTVAYEEGISTIPNRAYGYTLTDSGVVFSDQSLTSAVLGDGGIYSSLTDYFKWDQALYKDQLISAETWKRATTPYKESYGFGWRIDEYKGHRRMHHTGSTRGFRNVVRRFPDDRFTVLILTNRNDPDVAPLADQLVDWYLLGER